MSSNTNIRKMTEQDKQAVIEMMRVFYLRQYLATVQKIYFYRM